VVFVLNTSDTLHIGLFIPYIQWSSIFYIGFSPFRGQLDGGK
jgi:hypothetical protein